MDSNLRARRGAARIKGAALSEFLRWYARTHGAERLRRLPAGVLEELDVHRGEPVVLASKWYDAALIHGLLEGLVSELTPSERERLATEGARAVMEATLRGVYRLLFRTMMSPARYATHAQTLWDRYYDNGRMAKRSIGPSAHATEISEWAGHHPLLCDLHVESARYIYAAMGCRDVSVTRTGCVSKGAALCSFEVRWSD